MAKATKKTTETETKKHNRRTPEQIVADLEQRIADVKARAANKQAKADPAAKALLVATKALDKAIALATEHGSQGIAKALEASRVPLSTALVDLGVGMPDPKGKKRGRKLVAV